MPYREGYGVAVCPIFDPDTDAVADIEVAVVKLAPTTEVIVGGALCVEAWPGMFYPVDCFTTLEDLWEDDTHDLRDRWFATRAEAEEHAAYTERRWKHPQPWESFVKLG